MAEKDFHISEKYNFRHALRVDAVSRTSASVEVIAGIHRKKDGKTERFSIIPHKNRS